MTLSELRARKIELLDDVHELSQDPVGDPEGIRERVNELFSKLEGQFGEEEEG